MGESPSITYWFSTLTCPKKRSDLNLDFLGALNGTFCNFRSRRDTKVTPRFLLLSLKHRLRGLGRIFTVSRSFLQKSWKALIRQLLSAAGEFWSLFDYFKKGPSRRAFPGFTIANVYFSETNIHVRHSASNSVQIRITLQITHLVVISRYRNGVRKWSKKGRIERKVLWFRDHKTRPKRGLFLVHFWVVQKHTSISKHEIGVSSMSQIGYFWVVQKGAKMGQNDGFGQYVLHAEW